MVVSDVKKLWGINWCFCVGVCICQIGSNTVYNQYAIIIKYPFLITRLFHILYLELFHLCVHSLKKWNLTHIAHCSFLFFYFTYGAIEYFVRVGFRSSLQLIIFLFKLLSTRLFYQVKISTANSSKWKTYSVFISYPLLYTSLRFRVVSATLVCSANDSKHKRRVQVVHVDIHIKKIQDF